MRPTRIGVAGAGTMGAGIAQLAGLAGYDTTLFDPSAEALERALATVERNLDRGADRGRWSTTDVAAARRRLGTTAELDALGACELVIEAAPEELPLKRALFSRLERVCDREAILATNTSSLTVGAIAAACRHPDRVVGMHFFNPPPLMELVELVAAPRTAAAALATAGEAASRMGRTPIRCRDSPGFIVNRCNRPFTLEALQMLGDGIATVEEIDLVVRDDGGYRMGPFELIDLIGVDINLEVARSFFRQRQLARWRPSSLQADLVAAGRLGRKTGYGFHRYDAEGRRLAGRVDPDPGLRRRILERLVSTLVNEACFAVDEEVAAPEAIDTAMRLGLNHPRGPFEWAQLVGANRVAATLEALASGDPERYAISRHLRALAARG